MSSRTGNRTTAQQRSLTERRRAYAGQLRERFGSIDILFADPDEMVAMTGDDPHEAEAELVARIKADAARYLADMRRQLEGREMIPADFIRESAGR
jgi:hypothetical protein